MTNKDKSHLGMEAWLTHIGWSERFGKFLHDLLEYVPESEQQKQCEEGQRLTMLAGLFLKFAAAQISFSWKEAAERGWLALIHWDLFPEELKEVNPLTFWKKTGYTEERIPKKYLEHAKSHGFDWEE